MTLDKHELFSPMVGGLVFTILLSIISLAFTAGIEFNKITNIEGHQINQDNRHAALDARVELLQTTLPVQMATIQAKLDDISAQLKTRRRQ